MDTTRVAAEALARAIEVERRLAAVGADVARLARTFEAILAVERDRHARTVALQADLDRVLAALREDEPPREPWQS